MALIDLTGKQFGYWAVLEYSGNAHWLCRCRCGRLRRVCGGSLRRGKSTRCITCHTSRGLARTHGQKKTRLYNIWCGMIDRCENAKSAAYPRYGGRGIAICPAWRQRFETFRDWALANGYEAHLTIDRQNNDGHYEPDNCRWASYAEQNRNCSRNRPLLFNGSYVLITDLAAEYGLPQDIVKNRIRRYGWPVMKALTTPVKKRELREPWKPMGISSSTYYRRLAASRTTQEPDND